MRNRLRSWQYLSVSAAALLLVVTGMLAVAAPASASTVQVVPGNLYLLLGGVACPTATTCEAVGTNYLGSGLDKPGVVVPITNGIPGTPQIAGGTQGLPSVACPSATTCFAVGGDFPSGGVVPIVNGISGTPQEVAGTTYLYSVACPSATSCLAVGYYQMAFPPTGMVQGVVVPITNGISGTPQVVSGTSVLSGMACPSATTCEAVGYNALGQVVVVPITNGTPGTAQVVAGTSFLSGVACPSATTCFAVGYNEIGQGSEGVVVPITNGIPGTPQVVSGIEDLGSVACPTATTCLAVGTNNSGGVLVPITNGIPGTHLVVAGTTSLAGVACGSASTCEAVGHGNGIDGVVVAVLQESSAHVPLSVGLCQHGGWQNLSNVQEQPFRNQGQCISYLTHNP